MVKIEEKIIDLEKKLDQINRNFISFQDLILYMNTSKEIRASTKNELDNLAHLTLNTNERMNRFRSEIPSACKISNDCIHQVESATYNILCTYIQQGSAGALKKVDFFQDLANKIFKTTLKNNPTCSDKCYKNITSTLETLKDLMRDSKKAKKQISIPDITSNENWMKDFKEEEVCDLLTPLANTMRLKILITLGKGRKTYSQLERESGVNANLQFHLEKLIKIKYIIKEKHQGKWKYSIHVNGLKALKFLNDLKKELD